MIIPQSILSNNYRGLVHVEGWSKATVFRYVQTINGWHYLITPKTKKEYRTSNNLLYTNKNEPKQ